MEILQQTGTGLLCYWRVPLFWEALGLTQSCKNTEHEYIIDVLAHQQNTHSDYYASQFEISENLLRPHKIDRYLRRSTDLKFKFDIWKTNLWNNWRKTFVKHLKKKKTFETHYLSLSDWVNNTDVRDASPSKNTCNIIALYHSYTPKQIFNSCIDFCMNHNLPWQIAIGNIWSFLPLRAQPNLIWGAEPYIERAAQMNM